MQGELIESCRVRKSLWDGPFAMSSSFTTLSGAYTVPGGGLNQSPPYCMVFSLGAAQNVTMYLPNPATVMWCHELVNAAAGAFSITLKGASAGNPTIGTIAQGKRAEVIWNIYATPQEWVALLSA
jgi:hypothetical protein